MIEGPLSGSSSSDAASVADVVTLTATVATNTSEIAAKAPSSVVSTLDALRLR